MSELPPRDGLLASDNRKSLRDLLPWLTGLGVVLVVGALLATCSSAGYKLSSEKTPPLNREFRGMWIPSIGNICWPSSRTLSSEAQQAEMIELLDRAVDLNLNAVILQIRPAGDALYDSDIEPWSEYLTGKQGVAPTPYYDPLKFAVAEAHRRGLELHAWFNPFRVRSKGLDKNVSETHIYARRPELVRDYNGYLWLDPGEPDAQEHSLEVVLDVVKRYDIDAVHLDDYFYPYPEKNDKRKPIDFPDDISWKEHGKNTELSREDWRRQNVDRFVERLYQAVHDEKPEVEVGISPFGIWRPGHPPSIRGLDAYDQLYADARKWLREGWCDYLAPQLYWPVDDPPTSFPILLEWWSAENIKKRHLWPGLNSYKTTEDWDVSEILRQIEISREQTGVFGQVHWSASALMEEQALADGLKRQAYTEPAFIPASNWLKGRPPQAPKLSFSLLEQAVTVDWEANGNTQPKLWVVQFRNGDDWTTQTHPADKRSLHFEQAPDALAITALDRKRRASPTRVYKLKR